MIVSRDAGQEPDKQKKRWETPTIQKFDLSADELAQLRASDDPAALLRKIGPDIKSAD